MRLSLVNMSPEIFAIHPYTQMDIHLFESSGETFHRIPKTYWCG